MLVGQSKVVTLDLEVLAYSLNQELPMIVGAVVLVEVRGVQELLEAGLEVVVEPLLTEHLTQVVVVVGLVIIIVLVAMVLVEFCMVLVAVAVDVGVMPVEHLVGLQRTMM